MRTLITSFALLFATAAAADDILVAVAANFAAPMEKIAAEFSAASGHKVLLTPGATGKFYAQIKNGAPFDILLAADDETPRKLASEGDADPASQFTYAIGKLVLWSARPGVVDAQGDVLKTGKFKYLAIANPKLAPYGAAAIEVLKAWELTPALQGRLVQGENIAQTHQFVVSGAAELGFVALSQVSVPGKPAGGSQWLVPAALYTPIRQDAILLKAGRGKTAAAALLNHLRSEAAKKVIAAYGYGV